jgi:hypothetical protein
MDKRDGDEPNDLISVRKIFLSHRIISAQFLFLVTTDEGEETDEEVFDLTSRRAFG